MSDQCPSLLPPNATQTELAIEGALCRAFELPVPLRQLWNPDTCPVELLPWLAWSLSIDTWKDYWPESVKRRRIKQAVEIQRRKGTVKSVQDVVASFGANLALKEWWESDPPGPAHTFDILFTVGGGVPATAEYQQDIIAEVTRTKPVRSHFTFTAGVSASGGMGFQGIIRGASFHRLRLVESLYRSGMGLQGSIRPAAYYRISATEV